MSIKEEKQTTGAGPDNSGQPKKVSRRAMLKGTATVMPAILTLQSGAALARSSNLISASRYATTDRRGRTLCLDVNSVRQVGRSGYLFDMGHPATGYGAAINDRDYRVRPHPHAQSVNEGTMCRRGGTYYYVDRRDAWEGNWEPSGSTIDGQVGSSDYRIRRNWKSVHIRQGVVISAAAWHSVGGSVYFKDM